MDNLLEPVGATIDSTQSWGDCSFEYRSPEFQSTGPLGRDVRELVDGAVDAAQQDITPDYLDVRCTGPDGCGHPKDWINARELLLAESETPS